MTEMNVLSEYRKLRQRAMGIQHETLRGRMLDLLNAASDYAEIVTSVPMETMDDLNSDVNPIAAEVGAAKMKLRFTRAKRYAVECNILRLDTSLDQDRKLVTELVAHHTMLSAHVTKANIPASMHGHLRHAYLSGMVQALPTVPTLQSLARRARATVSNTLRLTTSH